MSETIFWWIFTVGCVFAFFFSYGMVEDLIRQWLTSRKSKEEKPAPGAPHGSADSKGDGQSKLLLH